MEKRDTNKLKLKFPIIENFVFIDIVKGKETLLSFKESDLKEITGSTWRQFQFIVQDKLDLKYGGKYPAGRYNYVCMRHNSTLVERGIIKTISRKSFLDAPIDETKETNQMDEIKQIKRELEAIKGNNIPNDILINLTKQGYEIQINFLNQQLTNKDQIIKSLNQEIEKLENELDKYEIEIDDLKSKSGMNQIIEIGQRMLLAKFGSGKEVTNLSASNTNDIPEEILNILGLVDYSQISQENMQKIISGLKQYISILPLKK